MEGMGGVAPSLINMSNGAVLRNLMGATTNNTKHQRIWGTLGAAEIIGHDDLYLRLGGNGDAPKYGVAASWGKREELGALAEETGYSGRDFWVIYYFARQILTGEKAPFDIYNACDVTIPGILAYRSSLENGKPYDIPDFRDKAERDAWRNDDHAQKRYDTKNGLFPENADFKITGKFTTVMKNLIDSSTECRAFLDWDKVKEEIKDPANITLLEAKFAENFQTMMESYAAARKIADAYPGSDGAKVLAEMLELGYEKLVMSQKFQKKYLDKNNSR